MENWLFNVCLVGWYFFMKFSVILNKLFVVFLGIGFLNL